MKRDLRYRLDESAMEAKAKTVQLFREDSRLYACARDLLTEARAARESEEKLVKLVKRMVAAAEYGRDPMALEEARALLKEIEGGT